MSAQPRGLRRVTSALAMATAFAVIGSGLTFGVQSAQAADGVVSDLGISVNFDGTEGFDADDLAGHDSGPNNGVVRSNDQIEYLVAVSFATAGSTVFSSTLPAGMVWDATAAAGSVCTGPTGGKLSSDKRTLTCDYTAATLVESFKLRAWVGSVGNGESVAPTITAGTKSAVAPAVTVSAAPKTEMRLYANTPVMPVVRNGKEGMQSIVYVYTGATLPASGNYKGYEALSSDFTYEVEVPPHMELAGSMASVSGIGGGTMTATQPGGPGTPFKMTVHNQQTNFLNVTHTAAQPSTFGTVGVTGFTYWVPFDPVIPVNVSSPVIGKVTSFDPVSLSGVSNFGDAFAPGYGADSPTCNASDYFFSQLACFGMTVLRTDKVVLTGTMTATRLQTSGDTLFGDDHGFTTGKESVVAGQPFLSFNGVYNDTTAGASAHNAWGMVTFDSKLLTLTGNATARFVTSGKPDGFYSSGTGTVIPDANRVIEYSDASFANDNARRDADPATMNWASNPAALPGGLSSVSAVRVVYLNELAPNTTVGLNLPLVRSSSDASAALSPGSQLPWFWQYGADEQPRVKSTYFGPGQSMRGGSVQAAEALVRTETSWSTSATAPGEVKTLSVKPIVIGPVAGASTTARDVKVKVALNSTCAEPVWSAVVTQPGYVSHTEGNVGADNIACTEDDGAPATITYNLGDLAAPQGAAGPAPYQGHATAAGTIAIPVNHSVLTPSGTVHTATIVISSPSDTSRESYENATNLVSTAKAQDRTEFASITVNGVASFAASKSAVTRIPGQIDPDEEMKYTLTWGNGTSDEVGRGTFVDLLPYNGDARGTSGLPAAGFTVITAAAETGNDSLMGSVVVQYTTMKSEDAAAELAKNDNSDGATGIVWKTGTIPANATAIRFITDEKIKPGFTGTATITLKAEGLALGGVLENDMYGKTEAIGGDANTIKRVVAASKVTLQSSAGSLSGTVYEDIDFDSVLTQGTDPTFASGTAKLRLVGEVETYLVDIATDGSYKIPAMIPGDYVASIVTKGWVWKAPSVVTAVLGVVIEDVDLLFQQAIAAPVAVDDTLQITQGKTGAVDVQTNDTWSWPGVAGTETTAEISGQPTYGSATMDANGVLSYAAAPDWPAEFAGSSSYEQVVTYTVTNFEGAQSTARVVVTIHAAPVAADDSATVPAQDSTAIDVLANDSGSRLKLTGTPTSDSVDVTVSYSEDNVVIDPSAYSWGDGEATLEVTLGYTAIDEFGETASAVVTVTVVRAPVYTGPTTVLEVGTGGSLAIPNEVLNPGALAGGGVTVTDQPKGGSVTVGEDGSVTFDPGTATPGEHTIDITYTDVYGQKTTVTHTVTVFVSNEPVRDTYTVAHSWPTEVDPLANDAGEGIILSSATTAGSGSVTVQNGKVLFAPDSDYPWADGETEYIDSAEYAVTDSRGNVQIAEIAFTVIKAPTGIDRHLTVANGVESVLFDPIGEATGTRLVGLDAASIVVEPSHGTVSVGDGTVTFKPASGFVGEDTFSVEIRDELGQTTTVVYTVTVEPAVDEPKLPETGGGNTEKPGTSVAPDAAGNDGGSNGNAGQAATPALAMTGAGDNSIAMALLLLLAGACVFGVSRRRAQPQTARS